MTEKSAEQPEALQKAHAIVFRLHRAGDRQAAAVMRTLLSRVHELETSQARVREIAVAALLSGSHSHQDWIDAMTRIEGITQGKQG